MMKAGDVVALKSGGPKMTVEILGEHNPGSLFRADSRSPNAARCVWFDKLKLKDGLFMLDSLVRAEE